MARSIWLEMCGNGQTTGTIPITTASRRTATQLARRVEANRLGAGAAGTTTPTSCALHTAKFTATTRQAEQAASGFVAVFPQNREQLYFCVLSFWEALV